MKPEPASPRVIVVDAFEMEPAYVGVVSAAGWSIERAGGSAPLRLEAGQPPITILGIDGLGDGAPIAARRIRSLAPESPMIAAGRKLGPRRLDLLRDLDLHGVYDVDDDVERLIELLESATGLLRRTHREKNQQDLQTLLVAKLCHDLRGSLHAIRGYAEMLHATGPFTDLGVARDRIDSLSRHVLDVTADYLDLARLDSNRDEARRDPVRFDALLAELREGALTRIGTRLIVVSTDAPTPGAVIRTDGRKLRAVLTELVSNAIKFTSARVSVEARSGVGYAEFRVTDDGEGFGGPPHRDPIAAFEQAREELLAPVPGQGVGLAMALRLVDQLGGSLTREASPTGGTAFRLLLPDAEIAPDDSTWTYH